MAVRLVSLRAVLAFAWMGSLGAAGGPPRPTLGGYLGQSMGTARWAVWGELLERNLLPASAGRPGGWATYRIRVEKAVLGTLGGTITVLHDPWAEGADRPVYAEVGDRGLWILWPGKDGPVISGNLERCLFNEVRGSNPRSVATRLGPIPVDEFLGAAARAAAPLQKGEFDLKAAPLAEALDALKARFDLRWVATEEVLRGAKPVTLAGLYTLEAALLQIDRESGLIVEQGEDGVVSFTASPSLGLRGAASESVAAALERVGGDGAVELVGFQHVGGAVMPPSPPTGAMTARVVAKNVSDKPIVVAERVADARDADALLDVSCEVRLEGSPAERGPLSVQANLAGQQVPFRFRRIAPGETAMLFDGGGIAVTSNVFGGGAPAASPREFGLREGPYRVALAFTLSESAALRAAIFKSRGEARASLEKRDPRRYADWDACLKGPVTTAPLSFTVKDMGTRVTGNPMAP